MLEKIKIHYFEIIYIILFLTIFSKYIPEWASGWLNFDSIYAFGIFMLVFIGYLLKNDYNNLKLIEKRPNNYGFILLFLGSILYVFGVKTDYVYIVNFSVPFFISGAVLTVYGYQVFIRVLTLIFLFTLCIPFFAIERLVVFLQMLSTQLSSHLINILGVNSYYEGTILYIEKMMISVAPGCSGLKSLYSLFFISIIYSYFIKTKTINKMLFIVFSLPFSIALNTLRITTVGFYALYNGYKNITEFHDSVGIVCYIIALGIMILVSNMMEEKEYEI